MKRNFSRAVKPSHHQDRIDCNSPQAIRRHTTKYPIQYDRSPLFDSELDSRSKKGMANTKTGFGVCYLGLISTCDIDTVDPSIKMGCGSSRPAGHSSHARPVELQPRRRSRPVMTLQQLGYYATPLGVADNPLYPPRSGVQANCYALGHVTRTNVQGYVAILASSAEIGSLYELISVLTLLSR